MGGGLTDYHRQKRKKEQKKNKEKRIAERDAKVLETKTVQSVNDEIRKLERHHKVKRDEQGTEIPLPHAIKSKLDRLRKELKILKEAEGEANEKKTGGNKSDGSHKETWKPLDNPQLSVYYDPVMNPFGEPPPGQPRLYHTADGRTTFHLQEAAMPGSRPLPPPRQTTDASHQPQQEQRAGDKQWQPHRHHRAPSQPDSRRDKHRPPPAKPEGIKLKGTPTPSPRQAATTNVKHEPSSSMAKEPPQEAPNLPTPSQAVKRGRSRLKADIWASSEEIQYHETTHDPAAQMKLEGVTDKDNQNKHSIQEWWYQDRQGQMQGPFPHQQMVAWLQAGYFPAETRAKPRIDAPWKPFHHYAVMRVLLSKDEKPAETEQASLQDRIATLRKEHKKTSIADRIAALRGDEPAKNESEKPEPDSNSLDDTYEPDDDPLPPPPPPQLQPSLQEMNEQIPAYPFSQDEDNVDDHVEPPPPPPPAEEESHHLPAEDVAPADMLPPPPPPPASGTSFEPAPYIVEGLHDDDLPLPPPPPPAAGAAQEEIPAYAVEHAGGYGQSGDDYGDDYPPPYPVADDYGDILPYPTEDVPAMDDFPVVGAYPAAELEPKTGGSGEPPVKKVKVDREVVSFLPTNLRKRKK